MWYVKNYQFSFLLNTIAPCPQLIFPSKKTNLVFGNLFEFSVTEIT
jgi:hypothetical protein